MLAAIEKHYNGFAFLPLSLEFQGIRSVFVAGRCGSGHENGVL